MSAIAILDRVQRADESYEYLQDEVERILFDEQSVLNATYNEVRARRCGVKYWVRTGRSV